MSSALELLAEDVQRKTMEKMYSNKFEFIDPITIIMIVGIIINVIKLIQECRANKLRGYSSMEASEYLATDVKFQAMNHGWLTRWRLKRVIKKNLSQENYQYYGDALLRSLLEVGPSIDREAVAEAMERE